MKTIALGVAALLIAGFSLGYSLDNDPLNAGETQAKNADGISTEAVAQNPALLGVDRVPRCGLMIAPISNFTVGAWSDKLAISPFNLFKPDSAKATSTLLTNIFQKSFDLQGLSPQGVSDRLTDKLKGGVTIYGGASATLVDYAHDRFAFDVTTHDDNEVYVPDGPLFALFSTTQGLQKGNTLNFSNIRADAFLTTDFTFNVGLPVTVPALNDFFGLRYGAGGLGVKYVMGHSAFHVESDNATVKIDPTTTQASLNGDMTIQTAGYGLHGDWSFDNPYSSSPLPPITGHGIGVDLGGILYDDVGSLSINVRDLGVLFWINQVRTVTYSAHTTGINAYDIVNAIDSLGSNSRALTNLFRTHGGSISDSTDSLVNGNGFATMLPLKLDIGYTRTWDMSKSLSPYLAKYATASADYEQGFTTYPNSSYIPRLSIGGEAGTLNGYLPVRMGFVLGGPELFASALGASLNINNYFSINAAYKAVGSLYFAPTHGMELAGGMTINWGMTLPSKYKVVQEYDRDHDGIPDSIDKCPDIPEDIDGFEDADGCPDYDNDNDGIPDSLDQCPNLAGDKANDGCPEFDRDKDGVPDSLDKCPNAPENYNGYLDEDGCPDTLKKPDTLKPTMKAMEILNTKLRDINFKTASAELLPDSYAALDYVVNFLKTYPNLRYEIQGHTDSRGGDDYNLLLSAARAESVRTYLISRGTPDSMLIAIGYGKTRPIATNNTAAGRALNRRVEFKYIVAAQDYSELKVQEAMFQEKIREARLKGVKY